MDAPDVFGFKRGIICESYFALNLNNTSESVFSISYIISFPKFSFIYLSMLFPRIIDGIYA